MRGTNGSIPVTFTSELTKLTQFVYQYKPASKQDIQARPRIETLGHMPPHLFALACTPFRDRDLSHNHLEGSKVSRELYQSTSV